MVYYTRKDVERMLEFHRLTVDRRAEYMERLEADPNRGCEYSFANVNIWGRQRVAFLGNFVVLFSQFERRSVYPFPLGKGDVKPVLDAIIHDARRRGIPCRITSLSPEHCNLLEELYPGKFRFHQDRDSFDYVYDIDNLATLTGKRYQSKRNFVNRFRAAHPNCEAVPLTEENAPKLREMVAVWYENRLREDPENDFILERTALDRALRHREEYGMEGLLLVENGEILAMTMGSPLAADTFDIHFEKSMDRVDGAYAVINMEFARYLKGKFPNLRYLNREDDLGLPGLRKAKLSYHPAYMVEKSWARLWEDDDEEDLP